MDSNLRNSHRILLKAHIMKGNFDFVVKIYLYWSKLLITAKQLLRLSID